MIRINTWQQVLTSVKRTWFDNDKDKDKNNGKDKDKDNDKDKDKDSDKDQYLAAGADQREESLV